MKTSILTKHRVKTFGPKFYTENGVRCRITANVRYDDRCGNGHNTFSITGEIEEKRGNGNWQDGSGGCIHEEIKKHFPELAPFIKWHLCSSDMPMHYAANAIYQAGNRDCNGLLKGEFRQHKSRGGQNNGVAGVPNWVLELPEREVRDVYATEKPAPVVCEWKPYGRTGEGKERDLEAARHCAIWPDATDDDLILPGLEKRLADRLPELMEAFRTDMETLGFVF